MFMPKLRSTSPSESPPCWVEAPSERLLLNSGTRATSSTFICDLSNSSLNCGAVADQIRKAAQASAKCFHLKIMMATRTKASTRPKTTRAPPKYFATQSIFFCDEAKRFSHFMFERTWSMLIALPFSRQKVEPVPGIGAPHGRRVIFNHRTCRIGNAFFE